MEDIVSSVAWVDVDVRARDGGLGYPTGEPSTPYDGDKGELMLIALISCVAIWHKLLSPLCGGSYRLCGACLSSLLCLYHRGVGCDWSFFL